MPALPAPCPPGCDDIFICKGSVAVFCSSVSTNPTCRWLFNCAISADEGAAADIAIGIAVGNDDLEVDCSCCGCCLAEITDVEVVLVNICCLGTTVAKGKDFFGSKEVDEMVVVLVVVVPVVVDVVE